MDKGASKSGGGDVESEGVVAAAARVAEVIPDMSANGSGEGEEMVETEDIEKKATKEQVTAVFGNYVISEGILANLNFSQLKSMKVVSKEFYAILKESKVYGDFISNARILEVTWGNVWNHRESYFSQDNLQGKAWRGVDVDVYVGARPQMGPADQGFLDFDVLGTIHDILDYSRSISVFTACTYSPESQVELLARILTSAHCMEKLQMDISLLNGRSGSLQKIWDSPAAVSNLKNLKSLELLHYDIWQEGFTDYHHHFARAALSFPLDREQSLCELLNLEKLATLLLRHLHTFRITKRSARRAKRDENATHESYKKFVPVILRNSRETLQDIWIHFDAWENNEDLAAVTLPHLKKLTVALYPTGQETLTRFLENNPSIEELEVDLMQKKDKVNFFSSALFGAIKRQSPKLKKLHIKTRKFDGGKVDWSFLGEMKNLKDLCVILRSSRRNSLPRGSLELETFGSGPNFLELLPKNQLERLSLNGLYRTWNFWNMHSGDNLTSKLNLLGGFRNLKRLRMFACRNSVDDDVMQFILKEMKSLEELEISHCFYLTDAGIAGTPPSASIANLKALKMLSVVSCPSVTPAGIVSAVKLPLLQHFTFVTTRVELLPLSFLVEVVRQNPSLEAIYSNYDRYEVNSPLELLRPLGHGHLKHLCKESPEFFEDSENDQVYDSDDDLLPLHH